MATANITRKNRQTGTIVEVVHCSEFGLSVVSGEQRWVTVCHDHDSVVPHATKALAQSWAASPSMWCEGCQEAGE